MVWIYTEGRGEGETSSVDIPGREGSWRGGRVREAEQGGSQKRRREIEEPESPIDQWDLEFVFESQ